MMRVMRLYTAGAGRLWLRIYAVGGYAEEEREGRKRRGTGRNRPGVYEETWKKNEIKEKRGILDDQ